MANNKSGIDTEKFLSGIIPSSYSRIMGVPFPDSLDGGLITGAQNAILPMTITTSDRNNDKISFVLLINPDNVNHGKTNAVFASMTRAGFITQMWGPNQDLLTATGKTAGFYASGSGLTNLSRQRAFGFKNFMALFSTYRNNGYELLDTTKLNRLTRVINIVHGVKIEYDGQELLGHFNNFTLDESAENPFIFNYNFEFVVSSLSDNYNEIRGHFIPPGEKIERKKPRLISKVGKTIISIGNEQFQEEPLSKAVQSGQSTSKNRYASDTLIEKYPDRTSQLLGPVLAYMKNTARIGSPEGYTGTEQNLYLAVFYPDYRNADPNKEFPLDVQEANPGIKTPADYVRFVNSKKIKPKLSDDENKALAEVAAKIGVNKNALYNLINFESTWNPQAKNVPTRQKDGTMSEGSSARGLIQFMDDTARTGVAGEHFSAYPASSNAAPLADAPKTNATTPK